MIEGKLRRLLNGGGWPRYLRDRTVYILFESRFYKATEILSAPGYYLIHVSVFANGSLLRSIGIHTWDSESPIGGWFTTKFPSSLLIIKVVNGKADILENSTL